MRNRGLVGLAVCALLLVSAPARLPAEERGALRLDQALRDLSGNLSAVSVEAEPGDEDAATLALLRRGYGVRTTLVSATRGSRDPELAVTRTDEMRAAAARLDADVRFLGLPEAGRGRSAEAVLELWGRDETVRRIVHLLREKRPQIVITDCDPERGSGSSRAVGTALALALAAAADPRQLPDEGAAFDVPKFYVATGAGTAPEVKPPVGRVDPVRGLSFAEMGRRAEEEYASRERFGDPDRTGYRLARCRIENGGKELLSGLALSHPEWLEEKSRAGTRAEILDHVLATKDAPGRDGALAAVLGAELTLDPSPDAAVPGGAWTATAVLANRGVTPFTVRWGKAPPRSIAPGEAVRREVTVDVPDDAPLTRPRVDHLDDPPGSRFEVTVGATVEVPDRGISVPLEVRRRVPVVPPLTLEISHWGRLFRPVMKEGDLAVVVTNHTSAPREVTLAAAVLDTDRVKATPPAAFPVPAGASITAQVHLEALPSLSAGRYRIEVSAAGVAAVRAPLRVLDVEVPEELRVGVVLTRGDAAYRSLREMGIRPDILIDEDLAVGDISHYDSIWLGSRPFRSRPVLRQAFRRLLDYVKNGGNLIVNSCRDRNWSAAFSPWPLSLGGSLVGSPQAPLDLARPDHRLLHVPNEIAGEDFADWIGPRGDSFPSSFDAEHFVTVLTTNEPGRPPLPGLLVADYGYGSFIYTSLAWPRELRSLNPGALKILANLVSYPWRR